MPTAAPAPALSALPKNQQELKEMRRENQKLQQLFFENTTEIKQLKEVIEMIGVNAKARGDAVETGLLDLRSSFVKESEYLKQNYATKNTLDEVFQRVEAIGVDQKSRMDALQNFFSGGNGFAPPCL